MQSVQPVRFDEGNSTTNQYPYAETVPRPAAVVRSHQRRFLSFPVMGATGIVVVVGEANKWSWSKIAAWFRPLRRRNSRISKNSLVDRMLTSIPGSLFHIAHKSVNLFNPSLTRILTCDLADAAAALLRPLRLPMMGPPKGECCCGGGILAEVWDKDRAIKSPKSLYWAVGWLDLLPTRRAMSISRIIISLLPFLPIFDPASSLAPSSSLLANYM